MLKLQSDIVSITGSAVSQIGGRPENQDDFDFVDTPVGFLVIICDGMGGGPGGKTASYIVKYEIATALGECSTQTPREQALKASVARAHAMLEEKMEEIPSLKGMGSTFVAVLINKYSAVVAHAGDSRCYQIRNGKTVYRSTDHSLVSELVKSKALTEEEARKSPHSNIISRGLGSVGNNVPEIEEIPYRKGDRFVLCTDGVWGCMPNSDLVSRFSQQTDLESLVDNISSEIDNIGFSKGGGHDNHTLAILEMGQDSILKPKTDWKRFTTVCLLSCVGIALVICAVIFFIKHNSLLSDNSPIDSTTPAKVIHPQEETNHKFTKFLDPDKIDITGENIDPAHAKEQNDSVSAEDKDKSGSETKLQSDGNEDDKDIENLTPKKLIGTTIKHFTELQNLSCEKDSEALTTRNDCWKKISKDLELLVIKLGNSPINADLKDFTNRFKRNKQDNYPIDKMDEETKNFHLTKKAIGIIDENIKFLEKINNQIPD